MRVAARGFRLTRLDTSAALLLALPGVPERTSAALSGALSAPDLETPLTRLKSTSLRLSTDQEARADALVPKLAADPNLSAFGEISRSTVLRIAVHRGLLALEADYLDKPKSEGE